MAWSFIRSPLKRKFSYIFLLFIILILTSELILKYSSPRIKNVIIIRLEAVIHRRVQISKMELGLFRGINLEDIRIFDQGTEPALYIKKLSLKFMPLPLLWRKVVVTDVSITDPEIIIMRGNDGRLPFAKLLEEVYLLKGKKRVSFSPFGRKRIKGGTVTIIDNTRELKLADNINALIETDYFHGASRLRLNGRLSYPESLPFVNPVLRKLARSLKGDFTLDVYIESKSDGELKCYGEVDTNEIEGHVYLITKIDSQDLHLDILHIRAGDFLVRSHGNIHDWINSPDFAVQSEFTNLPISVFNDFLPGITLGGNVKGNFEMTGPGGNLIIVSKVELKNNTFSYENKIIHMHIDNISGRVMWTVDKVDILELTGSQGGSRINLMGEIYGFPETHNIRLNVACSLKDNVGEIITLPPELKLEGEISVNADIKGDLNSICITGVANLDKSSVNYKNIFSKPRDLNLRLNTVTTLQERLLEIEKMDLTLDNSVIKIIGEIEDFEHPKPNLNIRMAEVRLEEVKRIIPFLREADISGNVEMAANIKGTASDIVTEGGISIADFTSGKVKIKDLNAKLELYGGELKLKDIKGDFYGGYINGSMDVSFKEQLIRYSSKAAISEVDIDKLLKGISSTRYKAKGKINGAAYFHGDGLELKNLNGEGSIEIRNGKTSGLPFFEALADITNISSFTQFNFESAASDFKLDFGKELLIIENLKLNGRDANFHIDKAQVRLDGSIIGGTLSAEIPRHVLAKSNKFSLLLFLIGEKSSKLIFDYKLGGFLDNPRLQWMESKLKDRIENILTLGQKKKIESEIEQAIEALTK
ncbi:MAG: AsmA family protein [Candidatus Omnitrophica bacterium]|nr:AsmA family protein [Candidatus Omnitrophota bacterium]